MYNVVLALHNIMRWVILILAVVAVVRAYQGWLGKRDWLPADRLVGMLFATSIDIQLLLGLFMFFSRGWTTFGRITMEHVIPMVVAVVVVHIGNIVARRGSTDTLKHRRAALWYTLTVIVILVSIPWARPLLPGL